MVWVSFRLLHINAGVNHCRTPLFIAARSPMLEGKLTPISLREIPAWRMLRRQLVAA